MSDGRKYYVMVGEEDDPRDYHDEAAPLDALGWVCVAIAIIICVVGAVGVVAFAFACVGGCSSVNNTSTPSGIVTEKFIWKSHTETWGTKFGPRSKTLPDEYTLRIEDKSGKNYVNFCLDKDSYAMVKIGDKIQVRAMRHPGMKINDGKWIKIPHGIICIPTECGNSFYRLY